MEGPPWYRGDHDLFLMNDCSALAMTTNRPAEVVVEITQLPRDTVDEVNPARPALVAEVLRDPICECGPMEHASCELAVRESSPRVAAGATRSMADGSPRARHERESRLRSYRCAVWIPETRVPASDPNEG